MPKVVGKMSTTDKDGIIAYGNNVSTSDTDPTPINKRIPQVYWAFNPTKTILFKDNSMDSSNPELYTNASDIPVNTVVFIEGEGNAYIRLPNRLGSIRWSLLSSSESKIFTNMADAEDYAANVGEVGEIVTVIDTANSEVLVYKIDIGNVLADVATSFLIQLYATTESVEFTATLGQPVSIGFIYNERYGTDSTGQNGTITYQIKRPSDENYVTVSSNLLQTVIQCSTSTDPGSPDYHPVYFDPSDYGYDYEVGTNTIRITVIGGESRKSKSISYNINVVNMYVQADGSFSDTSVNSLTNITYPWRCYGEKINKTVFLKITDDDTGVSKFLVEDIGMSSNDYKYTTINFASIFNKPDAHGTYTMEQWCAITETLPTTYNVKTWLDWSNYVDSSDIIESASIYFNIMYCPSNSSRLDNPLISATVSDDEIEYGDIINVVYSAYTYSGSTEYTNRITQTVYYYAKCEYNAEGAIQVVSDAQNTTDTTIRVSDTGITDIEPGQYVQKVIYGNPITADFRNGAPKETWSIVDYPDPSEANSIFLELYCKNADDPDTDREVIKGEARRTFKVVLGALSGDYNLNPADVPVFCYLSSAGKTNADSSRSTWQYINGGTTIAADLTNLNYVNNGWVRGLDDAICLRLSGAGRCTVPLTISDNYMYYRDDSNNFPLDIQNSIQNSGRTFIFDLNIHDVLNYNTTCLNWYSTYDGRGIRITPQAAYLTNEAYPVSIDSSGAINNKDDIPFVQIKDNERLQVAFVIERQYQTKGALNTTGVHFIRIYLNGELSKCISFNDHRFSQSDLPPLVIGSNDAIVDVYSIRSYSTALTDYQVLQNYISDRPTIKEKMAEYDKNNIYKTTSIWSPENTSGTSSGILIDYESARKLYPCFLATGQFSPVKGNKKMVGIIFTKPDSTAQGYKVELNCMDYYTIGNDLTKYYLCETNVQGTSSQIYAKKNYKFKFANIKRSTYESKKSYYYIDSTHGNQLIYCEFIDFNFQSWYGPAGDMTAAGYEYWEDLGESSQADTYDPQQTYVQGDIVYFRSHRWQCNKDCNFTGYGSPEDPGNSVFVPNVNNSTDNYIIHNNVPNPDPNGSYWYYVPAMSVFYYRNETENNISSFLVDFATQISEKDMLTENNNGSVSVNISDGDSISTSKTKYKLYQDGRNYMGGEESTFCLKVDYMSPDGVNSDNGRFFPSFFEDPAPCQSNNPYGGGDKNAFIAIPGYRCLMFQRDTEQDAPRFHGRYNFNYDKGNTKSFGLEHDSDSGNVTISQKWEYLDNKDDICNFRSYKLYAPYTGGKVAAYSALEATYPDQGDLEDEGLEPDYIHLQVLYSWILQRANFYEASTEAVAIPYQYDGIYYYNERDYRKAIFIKEFEKHFKKSHVISYHNAVEIGAVVDNRAKNMFLTCYDLYHDTNMYTNLTTGDGAIASNVALAQSAVNIKFTSQSIASARDLVNYDTGDFDHLSIDWTNSIFPIWYTSLYDMDSCYGVDNNGKNVFNYDVEISDIKNYDANGEPVYCFNGAVSLFWLMVEEAFYSDIKANYYRLRSIGSNGSAILSYETAMKEYMDNGAESIPPVVYNEDQRFKYMDILTQGYTDVTTGNMTTTAAYQYLCQGSKRFHKKWFIQNRIAFLDSKYQVSSYTNNEMSISMRINRGTATSVTPEEISVDITPAVTQYQYVAYGNAGEGMFGGKCKANETIHIRPAMGGVYQDIVFMIYGSSNVADCGDLSNLYPSKLKIGNGTRLKNLVIGNPTPGYNNPNLTQDDLGDITNCALLQKLDLRNCTGFSNLNLGGCGQIQEVYLSGTTLTSVNLPNGGSLRILDLPSTINNLTIKNQNYLESIAFESYDHLTDIVVENSSGSGFNLPYIIERSANLKRARIIGVNWVLDNKEVLNKLMACGGRTAEGTEIPKCVLTGTIRVREASAVNVEAWETYWRDYIADGSLIIDVDSQASFSYVTYNSFKDKTQIPYIDKNGETYCSCVKMSTTADDMKWFVEDVHDTIQGAERYTKYAMLSYEPYLMDHNNNLIIDTSFPENIESIVQKMDKDGLGYWCINDKIVTYSPNNYDLVLCPVGSSTPVAGTDGSILKFKRVIKNDYWMINDSASSIDSVVDYKLVLKDSNGNIVYTARNQLIASPHNEGTWQDSSESGGSGSNTAVIIDGKTLTADQYHAYLVEFTPVETIFVDIGEDANFTGTYPTTAGKMFSHWAPSQRDIQTNVDIYAHFIDGYTSAPLSPAFIPDGGAIVETYDINNNPTSYRLVRVNNPALVGNGATEIVIPRLYNNLPITAIGPKMTSSGDTNRLFFEIGTGSSLTSLYFETGSQVNTIEAHCFDNCPGLTTIEIPDSVTHIGEDAFAGSHAKIIWTGNPKIETIGEYAFHNYQSYQVSGIIQPMVVPSQTTDRNIPDSIKTIGEYAFYQSAVPIAWGNGSSLQTIEDFAFNNSTASSYTLPRTLISIGRYAFASNAYITSIFIPNSVKDIMEGAFDNCTVLGTVTLEGGIELTHIGKGDTIFANTPFGDNSANYTTYTNARAFYLSDQNGNKYLLFIENTGNGDVTINVANYTILIAESAAEDNTKITTLTFNGSAGVKYINAKAFKGCSNLNITSGNGIEVPGTMVSLDDSAFEGCTKMTKFKFGPSCRHIGNRAFANCPALTSMILSDNLETIGDYAFYNTAITTITVPNTAQSIGTFAFNRSNSLTSITVPFVGARRRESTLTIDEADGQTGSIDSVFGYIFGYQINAEKIKVGDNLKGKTIYFNSTKGSTLANITSGANILKCDQNIGTEEVEDIRTILSIDINADNAGTLPGYGVISHRILPNSASYAGTAQFMNGSGSELAASYTVPTDLDYIVTSINDEYGDDIFVYNPEYVTLVKDTNITPTVQYYAPDKYEEYYIPSTLTTVVITDEDVVKYGSFNNMVNLTTVGLNNKVAIIEDMAFSGCSKLTSLNGGTVNFGSISNLVHIGNNAFFECEDLVTLTLPSNVASLGEDCFYGCSTLTTLSVPATLKSIGTGSFTGCSSLNYYSSGNIYYLGNSQQNFLWAVTVSSTSHSSYTLHNDTIGIFAECFKNCASFQGITITANIEVIGERCFVGCSALTDIGAHSNNQKFASENNVLYNKAKTELVAYPTGKSNSNVVNLPNTVVSIRPYACQDVTNSLFSFTAPIREVGEYAFYGCGGLTNIVLADTVTDVDPYMFFGCDSANIVFNTTINSLGEYAFYNCASMSAPTLSPSITDIPQYCFYGCTKLIENKSMTIPADVEHIGQHAFHGVTSNVYTLVFEPGSSMAVLEPYSMAGYAAKFVNLPDGLTEIQHHAFHNSGITSMNIVQSVTTIGPNAFLESTSLNTVTIGSGVTSIGSKAFYGCTSLSTINVSSQEASRITLENIDAFKRNAIGRLIVVPNGTMTKYVGATNWSAYEILIVEQDDYNTGITTLEVELGNGSNPSISLIKFNTLTQQTDQGSEELKDVWMNELTTVIWGDRVWTGPCDGSEYWDKGSNTADNVNATYDPRTNYVVGDTVVYGHINWTCKKDTGDVDDDYEGCYTWCSNGASDESGKSITFYRSNYQTRQYMNNGNDHSEYVLSNCSYYTRTATNAAGQTSTSYSNIPMNSLRDGTKFTVKVVNRGKWRPVGLIFSNTASIKSAIIDSNLTTLDSNSSTGMFYGASNLISVTFPRDNSAYTKLGNGFFEGCSKLEEVSIPATVKTLGNRSFAGCTKLSDVNINDIEYIGTSAFLNCSSLNTATFDAIREFGLACFSGCNNLERVVINREAGYLGLPVVNNSF